jgi:hypothetical protein
MLAHDMADFASKLELENDGRKRFVSGEAPYLVGGPVWGTSRARQPRGALDLLGQPRRHH